MSTADIRGRFVWHELTTTSPEGASAFYGKLLPWKTQPTAMPSYRMWTAGKATVGGLAGPEEGDESDPHWLVYIGTADADATVAQAQALGATVVTPVTEIPGGMGRFAVLDDPQGARFAVFTPGSGAPPHAASGAAGEFSWHELATTDAEEATDFYTELFGWERGAAHDLGGSMGPYQLVELDGQQIGGIHKGRPGTSPRWLSYVRVVDADEAADIARAAGGRVVNGPMEVPGGSWIVMLQDPQGAAFAVHEPATPVQPVKPVKAPGKLEKVPEARRVVAAEQPKPAVASELLDEDDEEDDEPVDDGDDDEEGEEHGEAGESHAVDEELKPVRRPARKKAAKTVRRAKAPARKTPAKRAAVRRTARKKAVTRAKTTGRARPVAKKKTRAKTPVKAAVRTVARKRVAPVRGRAAAPARRAAAKKAVRGRRR